MLRHAALVCAAIAGLVSTAAAEPIAARLPAAETAFYAEVDLGATLSRSVEAMAFVDPELAERIAYQAGQLHSLALELAGNYDFHPVLFEDVANLRLAVVVIAKDEPEEVVETFEVPKWDAETGEILEGEFEEQSYTEMDRYTLSFIVKTSDTRVATDFLDQFKGLVDRLEEQDPEGFPFGRQDLDVEEGELISDSEGEATVGRLDEFVVLSDGVPRELWSALMSAPEQCVSETALFEGLMAVDAIDPLGMMTVNLELLLDRAADSLRTDMEEAQEALEAEGGGDPDDPDDWEGRQREFDAATTGTFWRIYQAVDEVLSLSELRQLGFAVSGDYSGDVARGVMRGRLTHGDNPSPVLLELMEGSGRFHVPPVGELNGVCYMIRADVGHVYNEIIDAISSADDQIATGYRQSQGVMKMMIGFDVSEILDLLASDSYVFVDFVEKEREVRSFDFDEETGEVIENVETVSGPMPEVTFLWGLKDAQAARATLNGIFTQLAVNPQAAQFARKRVYQEEDVYCVGLNVADDEVYPDGMTSFALVVVDRYLTFGTWDYVTGIVRQVNSDRPQTNADLRAAIEANPDSNLIAVIPREFQEHMEQMGTPEDEGPYEMLIEQLEEIDLEEALDPEMAERIRAAAVELIRALAELTEKAEDMQPQTIVMTGTHHPGYYEWLMETEARR